MNIYFSTNAIGLTCTTTLPFSAQRRWYSLTNAVSLPYPTPLDTGIQHR